MSWNEGTEYKGLPTPRPPHADVNAAKNTARNIHPTLSSSLYLISRYFGSPSRAVMSHARVVGSYSAKTNLSINILFRDSWNREFAIVLKAGVLDERIILRGRSNHQLSLRKLQNSYVLEKSWGDISNVWRLSHQYPSPWGNSSSLWSRSPSHITQLH
jgi:hypothetical protein